MTMETFNLARILKGQPSRYFAIERSDATKEFVDVLHKELDEINALVGPAPHCQRGGFLGYVEGASGPSCDLAKEVSAVECPSRGWETLKAIQQSSWPSCHLRNILIIASLLPRTGWLLLNDDTYKEELQVIAG